MHVYNIYIIPHYHAGMFSYFWIGGLNAASTWVWIDGSFMDMGTPFWGRVSLHIFSNADGKL